MTSILCIGHCPPGKDFWNSRFLRHNYEKKIKKINYMHIYLGNLNKILFSFQKTNWERSKMMRNSAFQWDNFFSKKLEFFDFQWQISKFCKYLKNIKN